MPSVYEELRGKDIVRMLRPLIDDGALVWRLSNPKKLEPVMLGELDSPWVHKWIQEKHCQYHQVVLFGALAQATPHPFVPSYCQECWKIVARPKTLRQLWDICDMQQAMKLDAKAGVERRPQVPALYGAYWYSRGLKEGKALHEKLSKLRPFDDPFQPVPLILKRGCSEYEWACGDSKNWEVLPGQLEFEKAVADVVDMKKFVSIPQPYWVQNNVRGKWIEWAWEHGDDTVLEFTGGKPLAPRSGHIRRKSNAYRLSEGIAGQAAEEGRSS